MIYRLEFELPGLPKNANARLHWCARHRENQKWKVAVVYACADRKPPAPLSKAKLVLTRVSSVAPDHDNIVAGFKPIIDGLVECGVLENDRFQNIGAPEYRWEKCAPKKGCVRVVVNEVVGSTETNDVKASGALFDSDVAESHGEKTSGLNLK